MHGEEGMQRVPAWLCERCGCLSGTAPRDSGCRGVAAAPRACLHTRMTPPFWTLQGVPNEIDLIAASFVRKGSDLDNIRQVLGPRGQYIKIISKVENHEGVSNFDEILAKSGARGVSVCVCMVVGGEERGCWARCGPGAAALPGTLQVYPHWTAAPRTFPACKHTQGHAPA